MLVVVYSLPIAAVLLYESLPPRN